MGKVAAAGGTDQWTDDDDCSWGIGSNILGINGECWGQVIDDEGHCWRLASGRIAKKETEGLKWNWEFWTWDVNTEHYVWTADTACHDCGGVEREIYSMLWCRVALGSPYLIEGNLMKGSGMHYFCWCQDPSEQLDTQAEDWNTA